MKSKFPLYICILFIPVLFVGVFMVQDAHAACASVPAGGSYTVSASCAFNGTVNGVDNGGITINPGVTLTINPGQTVVWSPGSSIVINGAAAINVTGQLKQTRIWMLDSDSDGYPATTTQVAQNSSPDTGYRYRADLTSFTSPDVNDGSASVWRNLDCYTDGDGDGYDATGSTSSVQSGASCPSGYISSTSGTDCLDSDADVFQNITNLGDDDDQDGYYEGSLATQCVGSSGTVSSRTYYRDEANALTWVTSGTALGSGDCNDASATKWRNRYLDGDGDSYGTGSLVCVGNDAGYVDNSSDCLDSNVNVYQNIGSLGDDTDQDRYGTGSYTTRCVGAKSSFWYKGTAGTYIWISTSDDLGTSDCNTGDGTRWRNRYPTAISSCQAGSLTCVGSHGGYQDTIPFFTVFAASSLADKGNIGGTAGADSRCNTLASGAGLSGTYTAWISKDIGTEPRDRGLSTCATAGASSVAWYLPDGTTKVTDNWSDLTTINHINAIYQDENQAIPPSYAYTCTVRDGSAFEECNNQDEDCVNWTSSSNARDGIRGRTNSKGYAWSIYSDPLLSCTFGGSTVTIYCFQSSP